MGFCHSQSVKTSSLPPSHFFFKTQILPPLFLDDKIEFSGSGTKTSLGGIFSVLKTTISEANVAYQFFYAEDVACDEITAQIARENSLLQEINSLPESNFFRYHGPFLLKDEKETLMQEMRIVVFKFETGSISLKDLLLMRGPLSEKEAISVALSLAHSLVVLHEKRITHRNVKLENIMITWQNDKIAYKFLNFSEALQLNFEENEIPFHKQALLHESLPELNTNPSPKTYDPILGDVYCFGLMMKELLGFSSNESHLSEELKGILKKLQDPIPKNRFSFEEIENILSNLPGASLDLDAEAIFEWKQKQMSTPINALRTAIDNGMLFCSLHKPKIAEHYMIKAEKIYKENEELLLENNELQRDFMLFSGVYYDEIHYQDMAENFYNQALSFSKSPHNTIEVLKKLANLNQNKPERMIKLCERLHPLLLEQNQQNKPFMNKIC